MTVEFVFVCPTCFGERFWPHIPRICSTCKGTGCIDPPNSLKEKTHEGTHNCRAVAAVRHCNC